MKRLALVLVSLALAASCSGPGRYAGGGDHGPFCPRIDAAAAIPFSSDRADVLIEIASDPSLSAHEQCHLIDVTIAADGFSGDKTRVFLALAKNPHLAAETRDYLAQRLPDAELFSSDQSEVTARLVEASAPAVRATGS